jgi:hypothetical protein
MEATREYKIIVRDTSFVLFDDQIHRDAPNYFTNCFEGPFKESRDGTREMKLNRDPYLFTFIHTYLCGYDVLPLPITDIPPHLSEESRLKNLLADAHYYGLDSLAEELKAAIRPMQARRLREEQSAQPKEETWKILYVTTLSIRLC